MGWEAIVSMILKFLPSLITWIVDLIKGIKGKPAFSAHLAAVTPDHGAQVLDALIGALQVERAKLAPIAEVA
jgi:hypothetical protein